MFPHPHHHQEQQYYHSQPQSQPSIHSYAPNPSTSNNSLSQAIAWNQHSLNSDILSASSILQSATSHDAGSTVTSPGTPKKGGGRPRDRIWELFNGDRDEVVSCRYCRWSTDHPKAFRMRQHAESCANLPEDVRQEMKSWALTSPSKDGKKRDERSQTPVGSPTPAKKAKKDQAKRMPVLKSPITCHVLDSTSGKPAADMRVRIDRLTGAQFEVISSGVSDKDGRCQSLLAGSYKLEMGIYKITFFTNEYFSQRGILSFYPFVEVPFEVKNTEEHYHIPLLLSPYSYSTYRGS